MAAYDYDCAEISNDLISESGRYIDAVAKKMLPYMPWVANTPRGEWRDGMGKSQQSIVWERTVPTDAGTEWTDEIFSDGSAPSGCDYTPEIIEFGQSVRPMTQQTRYFRTNWYCLEDIRSDLMFEQFLRGIARNMAGVTNYVWATRHRRNYSDMSQHKLTANAGWDIDATSFDAASPPTSVLLNGHLEQIYDYLVLEGAIAEGSIGLNSRGKRIFPLITSANTSRNLFRMDPHLRDDFRYAFMGMGDNSPLINAYGMGDSHNGYRHVIDMPRRFNIVDNAYVEVHPYSSAEAAYKGKKNNVNTDYMYAEYEDSVIHIPTVYRELVPRSLGMMPGGFNFTPQNYMGEFAFANIVDVQCNPLGNKGFFQALFKSGAEPGETWFGFVVRHRTCPPDVRPIVTCYS